MDPICFTTTFGPKFQYESVLQIALFAWVMVTPLRLTCTILRHLKIQLFFSIVEKPGTQTGAAASAGEVVKKAAVARIGKPNTSPAREKRMAMRFIVTSICDV